MALSYVDRPLADKLAEKHDCTDYTIKGIKKIYIYIIEEYNLYVHPCSLYMAIPCVHVCAKSYVSTYIPIPMKML